MFFLKKNPLFLAKLGEIYFFLIQNRGAVLTPLVYFFFLFGFHRMESMAIAVSSFRLGRSLSGLLDCITGSSKDHHSMLHLDQPRLRNGSPCGKWDGKMYLCSQSHQTMTVDGGKLQEESDAANASTEKPIQVVLYAVVNLGFIVRVVQ